VSREPLRGSFGSAHRVDGDGAAWGKSGVVACGGGGATGAERTADGSIACAVRRAEGGGARSAQRGAEPELRGERSPAAYAAALGRSGSTASDRSSGMGACRARREAAAVKGVGTCLEQWRYEEVHGALKLRFSSNCANLVSLSAKKPLILSN